MTAPHVVGRTSATSSSSEIQNRWRRSGSGTMREAIAGGWGTLAVMIRAHAFRDGIPIEGDLLLGDAERLLSDAHVFVWIDAEQPSGEEIDALGAIFGLHPVTIEDAHHLHQRPKVELFEGYAFEVVRLRRFAAPLRQALDLLQEEPKLTGSPLAPYYRDVTEHVIRVTELADNIRDLLTSLLEVRVSQVANRSNEIMKKLSAWAGIILVPTLIAGIYGMNFEGMPELRWTLGYPAALGTMLLSGGALYVMFKRRGWL